MIKILKKSVLSAFVLLSAVSGFALTKLKLQNGIAVSFEGCQNGSIRFEAVTKGAKSPAKQYELKQKPSKEQFVKDADGSYTWNDYKVTPVENGYSLSFQDKLIYTSTFSEDKKLLKELRDWSTAQDFYGFGEASRYTSLKDQLFTIYNESKYGDHAYLYVPFYVSNESTAVYYNAGGKDKIYFQNGKDKQLYSSEYKRIECFVCQDSTIAESIQKFYAENEVKTMLPKWAYGYIQSKYGYKSQEEVIDLINKFKEKNIPLDAVVLDVYWFDKMGDISWTSPDFKDHQKMTDFMKENNVKLVTITEPYFSLTSQNYDELKKSGLLCASAKGGIATWNDWWTLKKDRGGSLFNPLGKKAPDFMGKKYSAMVESGIDGFWTDLGEPERASADVKYNSMAEKDFHNYYNYYWSKALYDGIKKNYPDKRLFILSRSGYTGIGKFNVSVWSGDVTVSWGSLSNQIAYGVNAGVSGLSYWGSDVGGFTPEATFPELFVRWHQFGAFTPVYRAHGNAGREPWIFTEKEEKIVSDLIRTREKLLPYIYSTARQTMNGIPMMRGMFLQDPATPPEFQNTQYMFGDAFLVAPVTESSEYTTEKSYWLPKGSWYNFYSMEKTESKGQIYTVKSKIENIPVFVKAGSIIPQEEKGTSSVLVIPQEGLTNSFTLYNDDGETEQYKSGSFGELKFTLDGYSLKAEISGDRKFLPELLKISYPDKDGKMRSISTTVENLTAGIEL